MVLVIEPSAKSTAVTAPSRIFAELTAPSGNFVVIIASAAMLALPRGGKMLGATYTKAKEVTKQRIHVTTIIGIAFFIEVACSDNIRPSIIFSYEEY